MVVWSPTPFRLGRNGCWPSRGSQLPRALPFIFSLCCPLNDRSRAAHSFLKIGRLSSLLLLLMSGNVHPKPDLFYPCSGNVTWRGKSVQSCICPRWVHQRCLQLSLSKFRALTLEDAPLLAITLRLSPRNTTLRATKFTQS